MVTLYYMIAPFDVFEILRILKYYGKLSMLRYRMAGITESAMVAYTHKYAVV